MLQLKYIKGVLNMADNTVYKNGSSKGNIKYYISYKPEHSLMHVNEHGEKIILHRVILKKDVLLGDLENGVLLKSGTIGGYVESGKNLSQHGGCWLDDSCMIYGDAKITGEIQVVENSVISGSASLSGEGLIRKTTVSGEASIHNADVSSSVIRDGSIVFGHFYEPNFSLCVKKSLVGGACYLVNDNAYSSIVIDRSKVNDNSVVSIHSENPCIFSRVFINNSELNGFSRVSIKEPIAQSFNEDVSVTGSKITVIDTQMQDSTLVLQQTQGSIRCNNAQLNNFTSFPQGLAEDFITGLSTTQILDIQQI